RDMDFKWLKKNVEAYGVGLEKFLVEKYLVYKDEDSCEEEEMTCVTSKAKGQGKSLVEETAHATTTKICVTSYACTCHRLAAEMAKEKGQAMAKAEFLEKAKRVSIKSPKNQLNKYESSSIRESSSFPRGKTVMELINDGFPVDSFVHVSTNWKTKVDAWKG
ncbi:hypothetical protein Tco_1000750, partial [Tanacetum coccineum]